MTPTFRLLSATILDGLEIATVYIDSFAEDAHTKALFPDFSREKRIADVAVRYPGVLSQATTVYMKSVDDKGKSWGIPSGKFQNMLLPIWLCEANMMRRLGEKGKRKGRRIP